MAAVPRSGKFFKLLQSQLDEMKAGTDTLPKYTFPGYNISPAPADGTKSPELAPCPTPATPATPATPPAVAPKPSNVQKSSASFNLMSMAYSPSPTKSPSQPPTFSKSPSLTSVSSTSSTESSTKTPTSTTKTPTSTIKTPTSSKFITPPSFTSNSEDMKKKFETLDLNNSKFKNKGSFFNKYNITPESPTAPSVPAVTTPPPVAVPAVTTPPTTPPTAAKPPATPSTPVSAPSSGGVKSAGPTLILKSNPSSPASSNPSTRSNSPGRTTSKQSPVRPAVRPITPPPDDNSPGNMANGTAIKPVPTVKPASTCTSPLPKFQNSDTPPLLSRQGSRSSVNQTPVKPRMVSLVDDSPPDPDTEEVTKQSPSLSKLMFGSGNPPAPTFNSPDRGYNRAATTNGAASHPGVTPSPSNGSVTPSNGSVTSPSTLGSTTEAPTTPKTSNGGTVNGGITPGGTANGGSSPGDNAKGGKKSLFTSNPILLPICKSCHQEIRGPYVGAQGRAWHSEHFVCTVCDGDLSQGFKEVDEKLFCGTCYFERFGEKCANCGKTCVGSVIQALGKSYHPEHFTCFECGNVLKEGFNVDNGNPYCSACHTNFLPLCAGCNKRIEGATQWISALEKDWHNGCFACGVCRAPLAGSSFYHDGQGKALCQVHARAASRPVA